MPWKNAPCVSISSIFKTVALSERGLLYTDDKAERLQTPAPAHASFRKGLSARGQQQLGSQQEHSLKWLRSAQAPQDGTAAGTAMFQRAGEAQEPPGDFKRQ